ncbi:ABC transporter permease [Candidatus Acetothermia bacterium]|nr:ABC transporter permease [Candidatus Acetothermia bacterium]MBI3660360.1 ABC transporter permease [Candidatus Acetothermia bacterium]
MIKLFIAAVKMQFRDRLSLFWAFVFPAMFIIIFGLFNFDRPETATIAIVNRAPESGSEEYIKGAQKFIDGFKQVSYFKIKEEYKTEADAVQALKDDKVEFVLVIPATVAAPSSANGNLPHIQLRIVDDEKNKITNQIVMAGLRNFLAEVNLDVAKAPRLFSLNEEPLSAGEVKKIKYMDILLPGILGMALMTMSVIGLAADLSLYRQQRILKRILATPLKPGIFVIATVFSYLVLIAVQVTVLLALGHFLFGAQIYGNLINVYLLSLLGAILFLNVGFIVGSFSKSPSSASSLGNIITMPLMFFSGVFFPANSLPPVMYSVVQFLPLTPLLDALRKVSIEGASFLGLGKDLALVGGWILITLFVATRTFKFRQD